MIERDEWLTQTERALADGDRVLVTGAPGIGKSRLLGGLVNAFEGVILVDAFGASSESDLFERIGGALGLELGARRERLAARIRELGAEVLALDHVERVVGVYAIADALCEGSSCKVVVASRRQDPSEGWSRVEVRPFDALAPSSTLSEALEHRAVDTLVRAARTGRVDWAPREGDVGDVAAIIGVLGGHPAALELAGRRLPAFGVKALAARLAQGPLPEYLDAALEGWWGALEEDVAAHARAAATFQGPFDVHALGAILGDDAFDALMGLHARSLLECDDSGSVPMYSMNPFVRAFCAKRMGAEECDRVRRRHADYFVELSRTNLEGSRARRFGPNTEYIARFAAELEHALEHTKERGDREGTIWLLAARVVVCWRTGSPEQVEAVLEEAGTNEELATLSAELHGMIALMRSDAGILRWNPNEARERLEEAEASRGDWPVSMTLEFGVRRADIMTEQNDPMASSYNDELLTLARENRDLFAEAITLLSIGYYTFKRGEFMNAAGILDEAIDILTEMGFHREAARGRTNLGFCYWKLEKPEKAYAAFEESIALFEQVGDVVSLGQGLRILSEYLVDEGEFERAKGVLERLLEVGQHAGLGWARGAARNLLAQVALECAEYDDALKHSAGAIVSLERDGRIPWVIASLFQQLWAALFLEDEEAAETSLDRILSLREKMHSKLGRALIVCFEAEAMARRGDSSAALESIEKAKREHASDAYELVLHLVESFECVVLATRYEGLTAKRERAATLDALMSILSGLLHPRREDQQLAPVEHGSEMRLAFRLLRQRLPDEAKPRLETEMRDPKGSALLVDMVRRTFRAPNVTTWADLSRRETPYRLLEALIVGRLERPGEPLEADALLDATWPDEEILPEAASNRLYVTISTLRRLGLEGCILSEPGGYMLDPSVPLMTV